MRRRKLLRISDEKMADIAITWTPFALRCLDEIHYYIEQESSIAMADKFIEKIFQKTDQLRTFPHSGQEENFLQRTGLKYRYLIEGNYKVIYEYIENELLIVVVDVFHTNQNPTNILNR